MHPGALRALEFDHIVEAVCGLALTPLGAARLADLRPQTDPHRVGQLLAATAEGVKYLEANSPFSLRAPADIETILAALAVQGRVLEPLRLLAFGEFLDSVDQACASVRGAGEAFPMLKALAETASSFKSQAAEVRRQIDSSGEVVDQASPDLRAIRDRLRKQRSRLRSTLESYLRSKETSRYLQDQVVTDRNGRYVLVVRAEHRAAIPGIIHGSSGSGASLFLEPLSTVEINNDVVALEQQEAEEVQRILRALTDLFRARPVELHRTLEVATELDIVHARARFAQLTDGVAPSLSMDGRLELRAARHPLLVPAVIARLKDSRPDTPAREPVPVDLFVVPPTAVLLITGPNTGGKTVALKTVGLCALMAQAGLFVPAAQARLPVFRSLFADIGDEQSISASLSTFSWHVTNIASMDRALTPPALVLLDEIGAGTDPIEGGALGVAIVDHFRQRGAIVISTTHSDALKTYASTTAGVTCAAFGFDPDTFAPTYRLVYGTPGRSLAIEIAGRLGLNAAIIEAARHNLSAREAQLAQHLAKVDADLRALEDERRLLKRERETLNEADGRARAREETARQREESWKQRLNERLDERARQARAEIDAIIVDLRRQASELAAQAARRSAEATISTGETGRARADARAAVDAVVDRLRPAEPGDVRATEGPARAAAVGDRVAIAHLGLEGTVALVHDREAEVDVRGKRLRVQTGELRVLETTKAPPAKVSVNVQLQPREGSQSELMLVGCTVDEALTRVEKFLDESLLSEQRTVRLIHGYGTGQLRRAVAEYLRGHFLVASFQSAVPEQGGGGVTVVELKE
jgi:DNA mismatch repair protein MutS2